MVEFEQHDIFGEKADVVDQIYRRKTPVGVFLQNYILQGRQEVTREKLEAIGEHELKTALVKGLNEALGEARTFLPQLAGKQVQNVLRSPDLGTHYHAAVTDDDLNVDKASLKKYIDDYPEQGRRLMRLVLADAFPKIIDLTKWYVALDLGSESMAAYYTHKTRTDAATQGMLDLQVRGTDLRSVDQSDLAHSELAPRLRNRIPFKDTDHPENPFESSMHAALDFFSPQNGQVLSGNGQAAYYAEEDAAMRYFYTARQAASEHFIPNPKLIFQQSLGDIVPAITVKPSGGPKQPRRPAADALIQHLTTHVFRNLICHCGARAPQQGPRWFPEEIHLLVTVPNVYSLAHKQALVGFLEEHSGAGRVSACHESEAVAYYGYLGAPSGSPTKATKAAGSFSAFRAAVNERNNESGKDVYLFSLDVGRGTADAALWRFDKQGQTQELIARNGNSDGGNRLSYLFVKHFDEKVKHALRAYNRENGANEELKFDFLHTTAGNGRRPGTRQYEPLLWLEAMIELLKRSCNNRFAFALSPDDWATYEENARKVAGSLTDDDALQDVLSNALAPPALPYTPPWSLTRSVRNFAGWLQALLKPGRSPASRGASRRTRRAGAPRKSRPSDELTEEAKRYHEEEKRLEKELLADINGYVNGVLNMLDALWKTAEETARVKSRTIRSGAGFALVAGQASQFAPLKNEITNKLVEMSFAEKQCYTLTGTQAKEACCRGAVRLAESRDSAGRPDVVSGYYGFLDMTNELLPLDMDTLRSGQSIRKTPSPSTYTFAFSQIPIERALNGGGGITKMRKVGYDGQGALRVWYDANVHRIRINGQHAIDPGAYAQDADDLSANLWPEALREGS